VYSRTWGWYTFDVTDVVRGWVDGSFPNYGLMVRGPESSGILGARLGFGTREFLYHEPYLEVTYAGAAASEEAVPDAADILKPATCGRTITDVLAAQAGTSAPDGSGFVERSVCSPINE
jgi:hypothetical protein